MLTTYSWQAPCLMFTYKTLPLPYMTEKPYWLAQTLLSQQRKKIIRYEMKSYKKTYLLYFDISFVTLCFQQYWKRFKKLNLNAMKNQAHAPVLSTGRWSLTLRCNLTVVSSKAYEQNCTWRRWLRLQILPQNVNSVHSPLVTANIPRRQLYWIPKSLPIPKLLAHLASQTLQWRKGTHFSHKLWAQN